MTHEDLLALCRAALPRFDWSLTDPDGDGARDARRRAGRACVEISLTPDAELAEMRRIDSDACRCLVASVATDHEPDESDHHAVPLRLDACDVADCPTAEDVRAAVERARAELRAELADAIEVLDRLPIAA